MLQDVRTNTFVGNPVRQCVGKERFHTKKHCKLQIRRHKGGVLGKLTAYRCPHCGFFHLGKWHS